jgi:hypothetical protein
MNINKCLFCAWIRAGRTKKYTVKAINVTSKIPHEAQFSVEEEIFKRQIH